LRHGAGRGQAVSPPTRAEREQWVEKVTRNTSLCGSPELESFLGRYRAYTSATGDSEYLVKTFNNLANRVVGRDASKADWAANLLNEGIRWQPYNPHNYTSFPKFCGQQTVVATRLTFFGMLDSVFLGIHWLETNLADCCAKMVTYRCFGRIREAAAHFPDNVFSRTGLALAHLQLDELDEALEVSERASRIFRTMVFLHILVSVLQRLNRVSDARKVLEQTCRAFPKDPKSRTELGNLLIDLGDLDGAEALFQEARSLDAHNEYAQSDWQRFGSLRAPKRKTPPCEIHPKHSCNIWQMRVSSLLHHGCVTTIRSGR